MGRSDRAWCCAGGHKHRLRRVALRTGGHCPVRRGACGWRLVSILLQAFCNLVMMRYAVYSGEPIIVGGLRTWPGPACWMGLYGVLDIAAIWPYNASNAAVPLAAALARALAPERLRPGAGQGPGRRDIPLAFVPLVFGGTVYRMLEKIMTAKLVSGSGLPVSHWPGDGLLACHPRRGDRLSEVRHRAAAGRVHRARATFHTPVTRRYHAYRDPGNMGAGWPAEW